MFQLQRAVAARRRTGGQIRHVALRVQAGGTEDHLERQHSRPGETIDGEALAAKLTDVLDLFFRHQHLRLLVDRTGDHEDVGAAQNRIDNSATAGIDEVDVIAHQRLGRQHAAAHIDQLCVETVLAEKTRFLGNPDRCVLRRNGSVRNSDIGELAGPLRCERDVSRKNPACENDPEAELGQNRSHAVRADSARRRASASARRRIALNAFFL